MKTRAFLGLSHTPLMGLNPVAPEVDRELQDALSRAKELVKEFSPELVVLIAPDHYNGFFNELMPPFCIGTQATSVGDYLTPAGSLNVDEKAALELANWLMDENFDMAVSRRMRVDHGFAQPLQLLFGSLDTPPVVPLFLNAVAQPGIPRLQRCRNLGESIGEHFRNDPRRILFIGSGGLSHEPPVPTMADPDPRVRDRITERQNPTAQEREAKTQRVMAAGMSLATGQPGIKPLNPEWDHHWMTALSSPAEALDQLCTLSEASISEEGGRSAHESKTWLIARSALATTNAPLCRLRHYQAIPEYIAGFGILFLETPTALWYEDMTPGLTLTSPSLLIGKAELVAFASQWDPMPFHVDEEAGIKAFGSLTGPGVYMLAIKQKLIHQLAPQKVLASLGYDEIRFHSPIRPGDVVRLEQTFVSRRLSTSKPGVGIVTLRFSLINQDGLTIMSHLDTVLVRMRAKQ